MLAVSCSGSGAANPGATVSLEPKLVAFAESIGVAVETFVPGALGASVLARYDLKHRKVLVDASLAPEASCFVTAHELGHAIDMDAMEPSELISHLETVGGFNASVALGLDFVPGMREYMLASERLAFWLGEEMLQCLGLVVPKALRRRMVASCLASFTELFDAKDGW